MICVLHALGTLNKVLQLADLAQEVFMALLGLLLELGNGAGSAASQVDELILHADALHAASAGSRTLSLLATTTPESKDSQLVRIFTCFKFMKELFATGSE
eukprot:TRINITY_DN3090_c1_g4_i1.p1 TRINITY_DN3090_c1_g4~~TRINITY_DN3090_c1_g4_i1.p1  ORF type:complete len:101 (+),score=15.50 TRINITY_DN3090_c1_g4_i1:181-483(+)